MTHDARIVAAIGASGSGKSLFVRSELRTPARTRLVVWDFKAEYPELHQARTLVELVDSMRRPKFRVRWCPSMDDKRRAIEFDCVCRAVAAAGLCTLVVEELAFVTRPSAAPSAWRLLTLTGRHEGLELIATSQRPASIDKDFLANCTRVHVGRLQHRGDVDTVARLVGVDPAELLALRPLQWIELNASTGELRRGTIRPPGRRAAAAGKGRREPA